MEAAIETAHPPAIVGPYSVVEHSAPLAHHHSS
jgi:hypothetical protein